MTANKFNRRVFLWAGVFVLVGAGVWGVTKLGRGTSSTASLVNAVSGSDWIKGSQEAKVVLVEYSDFQCPACKTYYPMAQKLVEEYGDRVQLVYRHFPLRQHAGAEPAARAAEAAGKQGKFWEMHNLIFDNQEEWAEQFNPEEKFFFYAGLLGLDMQQFQNDFNSNETREKVARDYVSGIKSGVNSTPSFFLDGKKIQNPRTYDEFKSIIDEAVNNS